MNHCRDCNSDYATPGTCNCFAVGGKRHVAPFVPHIPWYPWQTYPYYGPYWWYAPNVTTIAPNTSGTITSGDVIVGSCTASYNAAMAGASNSCGM